MYKSVTTHLLEPMSGQLLAALVVVEAAATCVRTSDERRQKYYQQVKLSFNDKYCLWISCRQKRTKKHVNLTFDL